MLAIGKSTVDGIGMKSHWHIWPITR